MTSPVVSRPKVELVVPTFSWKQLANDQPNSWNRAMAGCSTKASSEKSVLMVTPIPEVED
jgi:hypothetical protein